MSAKSWAVVLSLCTKDASGNHHSYFTIREVFTENHYTDEKTLLRDVIKFGRHGVGLIVRPQFNDNDQMDFHEWRSFDGEPFKRIDWKAPTPEEKAG